MQATLTTAMLARASLSLRYPVRPKPEAWVTPEGTVPESNAHDAAVQRLHSLLPEWARKQPGRVRIARNLAVRWLLEYRAPASIRLSASSRPGPWRWRRTSTPCACGRERTEKEREKAARLDLERRMAELEAKLQR